MLVTCYEINVITESFAHSGPSIIGASADVWANVSGLLNLSLQQIGNNAGLSQGQSTPAIEIKKKQTTSKVNFFSAYVCACVIHIPTQDPARLESRMNYNQMFGNGSLSAMAV